MGWTGRPGPTGGVGGHDPAARPARPAVEIWNQDLRLWPDRPSNALMVPRLSDRTLGHVGYRQGSAHHRSDVPP